MTPKPDRRYKRGDAFVFNGEAGWTIVEIYPKGLLIEFKKPPKQAYIPFTSF